MDGKVILIEGLDLAGKSTLVRGLSDELTRRDIPVRVSRNALCPENPIAPVADALRRDPEAGLVETGHLFLASHLWDARNFQRPPAGTFHIQDSCWLRTLAYHKLRQTPDIPSMLSAVAPTFPRFDGAVFLTAGIEQRQRRLRQREKESPGSNDADDHLVHQDPELFMEGEQVLLSLFNQFEKAVVFDTATISRFALLCKILGFLGLDTPNEGMGP
jgi:thymidylate kinase